MVARNHHGTDSGGLAQRDGVFHLRTNRVNHPRHADIRQILFQSLRGGIFRQRIVLSVRREQHTQRFIRHFLVLSENRLAVVLGHGTRLAAVEYVGAAAQNLVRRAFGILHKPAPGTLVYGGHHLAHGVKRRLRHAREFFLNLVFFEPQPRRVRHKRRLGGLARDGLVGVQNGVAAQRHRLRQQLFVRARVLHDRHFILRQRTRFVAADDLRAAQSLHGGELANHGAALGHIRHADGKHHRHNRREALRNCRHGKAYRNHETLKKSRQRNRAVPHRHLKQVDAQNQHADGEDRDRENLAERIQTLLQRGFVVLRVRDCAGYLAHLRVHARRGDNRPRASVRDARAHVEHIFAVPERHILALQRVRILVRGHTLAG